MKRLLSTLCLACLCAGAQAETSVARIEAMLARQDTLCGRFDQAKHLTGMKRPLASSGRFCVIAGKGVLWRTITPFPNTLRVTRDEILHLQGKRVAMRLDAKQEPAVRMINSVLFSLLAGDLTQLETLFEVETSVDKTWKVALKARTPALAQAIGAITLDGGAYVRNIHISESGGDRTDIAFSAISTGEKALAAEEMGLF